MEVILCATKDKKLWHITGDKKVTYCGQSGLASFTGWIELPENKEIICSECLKKVGEK